MRSSAVKAETQGGERMKLIREYLITPDEIRLANTIFSPFFPNPSD